MQGSDSDTAGRLALVEDPRLVENIEDLDRELAGRALERASFAKQLPLMERLAIPQRNGRWQLAAPGRPGGYLFPGSFGEANLEQLDGGLAAAETAAVRASQPTQASRMTPATSSPSRLGNQWVTSIGLILLMFAGAASAALAFHDRLSAVLAHAEMRLK